MFELLHCPSTICFHFNYMVLVHDIPILRFNLFGISMETNQVQRNKQSQIRKKEKKTKNYVLDRKNQS